MLAIKEEINAEEEFQTKAISYIYFIHSKFGRIPRLIKLQEYMKKQSIYNMVKNQDEIIKQTHKKWRGYFIMHDKFINGQIDFEPKEPKLI
ncbi:hypothetical protein GCM10011409_45320 [Lentibacillus populi]|uniref:Uncharacterized protein n=1 Tax=Lentibacillus populi TaxID=1827502 RepID=A0A9W5U2S7_9BACI|nr:hypothetical protein [Lentibacillus populi]GGB63164.1 hypothetical protein GCM10011409_45320 [Lentibacillus populi]